MFLPRCGTNYDQGDDSEVRVGCFCGVDVSGKLTSLTNTAEQTVSVMAVLCPFSSNWNSQF